ncbi:MAG: branched-chain amino acid transport system substrate-binding protein [Gammaproteobacteria bacterium]|nr:branched-chain amino acid transport system substrate-binding protein [Gammaproteobacteria bacterium]
MTRKSKFVALGALLGLYASSQASAAADQVVIGDIDDMSSVYADVIGQGGIEAINMAITDFGGTVLGKKITVLSVDHQNKPDIGASKFREWADQNGLTLVLGGSNTGVSIAMSKVAAAKKVPFIAIGAGGASLTGVDCTPYTVHYAYDTTALGNGTASAIVNQGGKTWFFVTADYAFGTQLQESATKVVLANGGKVLGAVRAPLGTTDYSSFLLQAQASGAQVLGLSNAGTDFSNSLKAANEFGITKTMKPAALLAFLSDIHALTLQTAQGLYLTTSWYWDLNDQTRAFAKRFYAKMNRQPTENQAAYYSATFQYLNAVKAVGSTDSDKVMAQLKKTKINDFFAKDGSIRADGLMVHTMYVMQVKTPAESKYPWDYYKVIKTMTAEQADGSQPDQTCPMVKK